MTVGGCFLYIILRTDKVNLWKSDTPVSKAIKSINDRGLFVVIKSIQERLSRLLKQVDTVMRFFIL